jgi:purine catabolism regulator
MSESLMGITADADAWPAGWPRPGLRLQPPIGQAITVKGALRLPALRRGKPKVVAGGRNLDRPIRWVHAGEIPQLAAVLKGGELVLTTGMGLGRGLSGQRSFARRLAAQGVAGLVLELGECFSTPPPALVAAAEAEGLPVIALHRQIPFVEVTEAIQEGIVSRELSLLRAGEELQRHFTSLLLEGGGASELLTALADIVANPVLLEKGDGEGVLYHAAYRTSDDEVLASWEASGGLIGQASEGIAVPVPAGARATRGRLIVLALDSPLDEFDRLAIERSVAAVAVALLRRSEEELLDARERGNFLVDITKGRVKPEDAGLRAESLGFDHRSRLILPVAVSARPGPVAYDDHAWVTLRRAIVEEMRSSSIPALAGSRAADRDILLLLAPSGAERRAPLIDKVVSICRSVSQQQSGGDPDTLVVAVGPCLTSWSQVPDGLRDVGEAASLARHRPPQQWWDATAPNVDRLLWQLRDTPQLRRFVLRHIGELIDHDKKHSATKMLPTLEQFLDHSGNKTETARALHLRRQSLYYRIARIEQLLGVSLEEPTVRLALHVAVRARCFIGDPGMV